MKIRMKALATGPAGVFLADHDYVSPRDLSEQQARAFVDGGYAEVLPDQARPQELIESADAPVEPVEQAVMPAPKPRRARGGKIDLKESDG